jgi:pSer/pThr/pTyr-binding forkhead associated (FHA) protein
MSRPTDDELGTHQTTLPDGSPDEVATRAVANAGVVAELHAVLSDGQRHSLALYALADQIVVGRGSSCDWRLDDDSLSRTHAQFKWTGSELSVEDMGSANGTRVGARPARTAVKVRVGDQVQLGTVIITFEPHASAADGESTRLVANPPAAAGEGTPSSGSALPALATVVRAPSAGPPAKSPQVFRPSRDAAGPSEPTRPWDPRAALVRAKEKPLEGLLDRVRQAWRTNRQPFVLGGACVWIALVLGAWWLHDRALVDEEPIAAAPRVPAPKVSPLNPPASPLAAPGELTPPATPEAADTELASAIAAYDQGRLPEALAAFRRLAVDEHNAGAKFMVKLIESKIGGAP